MDNELNEIESNSSNKVAESRILNFGCKSPDFDGDTFQDSLKKFLAWLFMDCRYIYGLSRFRASCIDLISKIASSTQVGYSGGIILISFAVAAVVSQIGLTLVFAAFAIFTALALGVAAVSFFNNVAVSLFECFHLNRVRTIEHSTKLYKLLLKSNNALDDLLCLDEDRFPDNFAYTNARRVKSVIEGLIEKYKKNEAQSVLSSVKHTSTDLLEYDYDLCQQWLLDVESVLIDVLSLDVEQPSINDSIYINPISFTKTPLRYTVDVCARLFSPFNKLLLSIPSFIASFFYTERYAKVKHIMQDEHRFFLKSSAATKRLSESAYNCYTDDRWAFVSSLVSCIDHDYVVYANSNVHSDECPELDMLKKRFCKYTTKQSTELALRIDTLKSKFWVRQQRSGSLVGIKEFLKKSETKHMDLENEYKVIDGIMSAIENDIDNDINAVPDVIDKPHRPLKSPEYKKNIHLSENVVPKTKDKVPSTTDNPSPTDTLNKTVGKDKK